MDNEKSIALITPTLTPGGSERVMAEIANYIQRFKPEQIHFILLTGGDVFYNLDENIIIHRPDFDYRQFSRICFTLKIFRYLRTKLKEIHPVSLLCFGGRYNSFAIIASVGLGIKKIVSDRSMPGISYGIFIDTLNKLMYKRATAIIAQTNYAKKIILKNLKHPNIKVIGNPVTYFPISDMKRENIILNVGRFIETKHQDWLIEYFEEIDDDNWSLWFLGDGPLMKKCIEKANQSKLKDRIIFWGNQKVIDDFYNKSKIFAFTSTSEGFPNALAEAMSAGCACISYDCIAGPADLIEDTINGYLIDVRNHKQYVEMLKKLLINEEIRSNFGAQSKEKIDKYSSEYICQEFYQTLTQ